MCNKFMGKKKLNTFHPANVADNLAKDSGRKRII